MEAIIKYIKSNGGYAKMSELRNVGFQTRDIKKLVDKHKIEKVKAGLYKIWYAVDKHTLNPGFIDVAKAFPKSVITLLSAAEYYELSTVNPPQVHVAIPKTEKPPRIEYPPVKFYYWEKSIYEQGIVEIKTQSGIIKIYDMEKTICDLFRYRDKLGEDIAFESLKNYLSRKDFDLTKLRNYAQKLRIKTVLLPYIKAIIG